MATMQDSGSRSASTGAIKKDSKSPAPGKAAKLGKSRAGGSIAAGKRDRRSSVEEDIRPKTPYARRAARKKSYLGAECAKALLA